ncbi:MAG: hypothetical protein ACM3NQ_18245 [Bacteroidales bacterium]
MTRNRISACVVLVVLSLSMWAGGAATGAQMPAEPAGQVPGPGAAGTQGMPNARMMSGIPMPMTDLPDGTVSVRVVRGDLSNTIGNQPVDLVANGSTKTVKTDDTGRAQFSGLAVGTTAKAVAVVDGERLESQEFSIPEKGGVRLLLAASASASAAAAPAVPGQVTFGAESRIAIEFDDATLSVFYLLEIVNGGSAPVNPTTPVAFELPPDATGASVLEGSSPQAKVKGREVTVTGPFAPGRTTVQVAFQLPPDSDTRTLVQQFPIAFDGLSVVLQKVGAIKMQSPQLAEQREMPGDGRIYILGTGPALAANRAVTVELTGLPHHDTWPRNVALAAALIVLAAGAWMAIGPATAVDDTPRRALEARRDQLFAQLLDVEAARRSGGTGSMAQEARRNALMGELERIYAELDRGTIAPGGDKGLPA